MKQFFVPHGRITRRMHLEQLFLFLGLEFLVLVACSMMPYSIGEKVLWVSFLPYGYLIAMSKVKRLHDIGRSGYHYFLTYLPFYNLFLLGCLLFQKGESQDNVYGTVQH